MARRRPRFTRGASGTTPPPGQGAGGTSMGPSDKEISNAERLSEVFRTMGDTLTSIGYIFEVEIRKSIQDLDRETQKVVLSYGRDLQRELKDASKLTKDLNNSTSDLSKKLKSVKSVEQQIEATKLRQKAIDTIIQNIMANQGDLTEAQKKAQGEITTQLTAQLGILEGLLKKAKRFETSMGVLATIMKGIGGLPFIGPLITQLTQGDKIIAAMKKTAEEGGSKMKVLGEGLMQLGQNFAVGVLGLLVKAFETLVKLAIQFNQKAFDFAKNLGVSVEQAGKLHGQLMAIAHDNFLLSKEVTETYSQLTNTFGFLVPANKAFAETAALVQKRLGASAEQMAALATASVLAEKPLNKTYGILQASAKIEGARNKLALTQRQILDGIAKTSATVLLNFKGDMEALSGAIVRATKLGTSLEQVNKQASNLLDFETSISNEIEATVITGRETNLNRARELAMLGKTSELMEELKKQGVDYLHFSKLNTFEKEAEAKRIGLTIEEYSKLLIQQKQANDLGAKEGQSLTQRYDQLMKTVEGQKLLNSQLSQAELTDLKRASIQDKFNTTLEKFKEILGSALQGPVIGMLEKFVAFVNNTEKMKMIAEKIKGVFEGIQRVLSNIPGIMKAAVEVAKVLASISAATAAARIVMASGLGGPVAAIAGISAAIGFYSWISSLIDGAVSGGGMSGGMATTLPATAMAPPVNPATAAAETGRTTRGEGRGTAVEKAMASNDSGNVYLDSQKVGQVLFGRTSNQIYGLNMA